MKRLSSKYSGKMLNRGIPLLCIIVLFGAVVLDIRDGAKLDRVIPTLLVGFPVFLYFHFNRVLDSAFLDQDVLVLSRYNISLRIPVSKIQSIDFKKPSSSEELGLVRLHFKEPQEFGESVAFFPFGDPFPTAASGAYDFPDIRALLDLVNEGNKAQ